MPQLLGQYNGLYRVRDDNGREFELPEQDARTTFPDLFPDMDPGTVDQFYREFQQGMNVSGNNPNLAAEQVQPMQTPRGPMDEYAWDFRGASGSGMDMFGGPQPQGVPAGSPATVTTGEGVEPQTDIEFGQSQVEPLGQQYGPPASAAPQRPRAPVGAAPSEFEPAQLKPGRYDLGDSGLERPSVPEATPLYEGEFVSPYSGVTPSAQASLDNLKSFSASFPVDIGPLGFKLIGENAAPDFTPYAQRFGVAVGEQQRGLDQQMQAAKRFAEKAGATYDQQIELLDEMAQSQVAFSAELNRGMQQREQAIMMARQNIPKMHPRRIWNNTHQVVAGAGLLSAAIQGFLNPGGPNQVVEQIMRMTEQDMEAQKVDIETAKWQAAAAERDFTRFVDSGMQLQDARLKGKHMRLSSMQAELGKLGMQYESEVTQGKLQQMSGALEAELVKTEQQMLQLKFNNDMAINAQNADTMYKEGVLRIQRMNYALSRAAMAAKKAEEGEKPLQFYHPDYNLHTGEGIRYEMDPEIAATMSKEDLTAIRKDMAFMSTGIDLLQDFHRLVKETGAVYDSVGKSWKVAGDNVAKIKAIEAAQNAIMKHFAFATGGKQLTKLEWDTNKLALGAYYETWGTNSDPTREISKAIDNMSKAFKSSATTYGMRAYKDEYAPGFARGDAPIPGVDVPALAAGMPGVGATAALSPFQGAKVSKVRRSVPYMGSGFEGESDLPTTKEIQQESYRDQLSRLEAAADYLRSVKNKAGTADFAFGVTAMKAAVENLRDYAADNDFVEVDALVEDAKRITSGLPEQALRATEHGIDLETFLRQVKRPEPDNRPQWRKSLDKYSRDAVEYPQDVLNPYLRHVFK